MSGECVPRCGEHGETGATARRIESAPGGAGNTIRGLTHSSDYGREGLAVNATRTCETCGRDIPRNPKWSKTYHATRRFCDAKCRDAERPSITSDYTITESGCWEWGGHVDANGYGKAYDETMPRGRRVDWAHRVSYRRHKGEIPLGLELDHTCENPPCINPDHLDPVTKAEHVRRGLERNGTHDRQRFAAHLRHVGLTYAEIADALKLASRESAHSMVKSAIKNGLVEASYVPRRNTLSEVEREEIRDLYMLGVPQTEIAGWYDIDGSQVSRICNGRSNGHVPKVAAS